MQFFKKEKDIEFVDVSRNAYLDFPVHLAKDVEVIGKEERIEKVGSNIFAQCPGMIDYAKLGYIIPAWVDIHIKANKAGTICKIGSEKRGARGFLEPRKMNSDIVLGIISPQDDVPLTVFHVGAPWNIFTNKNISALILPANYHSNIFQCLHVWQGVVDYKNFHTANFIFSPTKKCEVHIKAGDPLLHVIPFLNTNLIGGYGPGTEQQLDESRNQILNGDSQYYRKFLSVKKLFKLDKNE
jgi:hypothetical protein|tara:strand:- start:1178 stop:1897 length:720 start_codon:yes stop_codon:yes gene_type:complete